jgi:hypothetical protein
MAVVKGLVRGVVTRESDESRLFVIAGRVKFCTLRISDPRGADPPCPFFCSREARGAAHHPPPVSSARCRRAMTGHYHTRIILLLRNWVHLSKEETTSLRR